jgi:hypothetical protein
LSGKLTFFPKCQNVRRKGTIKKGAKSGGDPRVRYTRKILKGSLLELMKEFPVTKIGVTEICAAAV